MGERDKALTLIEGIVDSGNRAEGLVQLIRSFTDAPDDALALANRAAECVRDKNDASKVDVTGSAARALADAGMKTAAANSRNSP